MAIITLNPASPKRFIHCARGWYGLNGYRNFMRSTEGAAEGVTVALTPNGWTWLGLIDDDATILLDHQTLTNIKDCYKNGELRCPADSKPIEQIDFQAHEISTSYYALEGTLPRHQDKGAMRASILGALEALRSALPSAKASPKGLQLQSKLQAMAERTEAAQLADEQFLQVIAPLLTKPIREKDRLPLSNLVAESATIHGVSSDSVIFIACMSAIWSNQDFNPALALIAPQKHFYEAEAKTAIAHLRVIEMFMLAQVAEGRKLVLLSRDERIVDFWLALDARNISFGKSLKFELRLACSLFMAMKPKHFQAIQELFSRASLQQQDSKPQDIPDGLNALKFARSSSKTSSTEPIRRKLQSLISRVRSKKSI